MEMANRQWQWQWRRQEENNGRRREEQQKRWTLIMLMQFACIWRAFSAGRQCPLEASEDATTEATTDASNDHHLHLLCPPTTDIICRQIGPHKRANSSRQHTHTHTRRAQVADANLIFAHRRGQPPATGEHGGRRHLSGKFLQN